MKKFHVKHSLLVVWFCSGITISFSQKMMTFQEATLPKPFVVDTLVEHFNSKQPGFSQLSISDKQFYYWVNYSRKNPKRFFDSVITPVAKLYPQLVGANLTSLKNDLFSSPVLPLLTLNILLIKMASEHAIDITSRNLSPSHNSSNGDSFSDRFISLHLAKCGSENISYGQNEPIFLLSLLYIDINVPDLGHRKALLNSTLTQTGIGSSFYKNGYIFLVEDFACSQE